MILFSFLWSAAQHRYIYTAKCHKNKTNLYVLLFSLSVIGKMISLTCIHIYTIHNSVDSIHHPSVADRTIFFFYIGSIWNSDLLPTRTIIKVKIHNKPYSDDSSMHSQKPYGFVSRATVCLSVDEEHANIDVFFSIGLIGGGEGTLTYYMISIYIFIYMCNIVTAYECMHENNICDALYRHRLNDRTTES